MAKMIDDLYHNGSEGPKDHLPVASGSKVILAGFFTDMRGNARALFQVDDQDSPWHCLDVSDISGGKGIPVAELVDIIRFDSHEEHLVFQQALTAHYLGDIAASLGNMEGNR